MKIGYACINMTLGKSATTNRGMTLKTFKAKGPDYAVDLAIKNSTDLLKILQWNEDHNIKMYRMSSGIIPWGNAMNLDNLPRKDELISAFKAAGDYAKEHGHRLTFHPGPFTVIASPINNVIMNSFRDLEMHAKIMDWMGLDKTPYNKINIHVNTTAGGKEAAMERFCDAYWHLSESLRSRLVVENDDKQKQYTVEDLMYIHEKIGIPITFDYYHHSLHPGVLTQQEALELAASTWPIGITQAVHYSESKRLHENDMKQNARAHSDYINSLPETYGLDVDIMTECKMKELALLPFIK
jgi:UV DNA damage endonuclease